MRAQVIAAGPGSRAAGTRRRRGRGRAFQAVGVIVAAAAVVAYLVAVAAHPMAAKPQTPAAPPSNGRQAMASAVWYALAAGAWVIFAAWPDFWSAPAGLLQGGLIGYAPATAWAYGDNPAYAEYHWHGLQLLAGNLELLAGVALFAAALAAAFRPRGC
jgi:hypothetical protein